MALLLEALGNWGIGAKTNAGYGRMRKPDETTRPIGEDLHGGRPNQPRGVISAPPRTGGAPAAPGNLGSWQLPCKSGARVQVTLSEEKTNEGGWKGIYEAGGHRWVGPIQNSEAVSAGAKAGDVINVIVKSINRQDISFEWPGER